MAYDHTPVTVNFHGIDNARDLALALRQTLSFAAGAMCASPALNHLHPRMAEDAFQACGILEEAIRRAPAVAEEGRARAASDESLSNTRHNVMAVALDNIIQLSVMLDRATLSDDDRKLLKGMEVAINANIAALGKLIGRNPVHVKAVAMGEVPF